MKTTDVLEVLVGKAVPPESGEFRPCAFFDDRLGCYLIEVRPDAAEGLAKCQEARIKEIGVVVEQPELRLDQDDGGVVWQVAELRRAWRQTFDWK